MTTRGLVDACKPLSIQYLVAQRAVEPLVVSVLPRRAWVNLDSERPVVWDMGAIANQDTKTSRQLFRRILLASASIPAAFPPVFIKVETEGKTFEEMHVDGGTTDNAFLLLPTSA